MSEERCQMTRLASILILLICIPALSSATTYVVKPDGTGDFPTIQAAVDFATGGDVIELTDGVFVGAGNRDIEFLGKSITVRSQSGNPRDCIMDCTGDRILFQRGFYFRFQEDDNARVENVTIRNGTAGGDD
jgi:hypothetical protein